MIFSDFSVFHFCDLYSITEFNVFYGQRTDDDDGTDDGTDERKEDDDGDDGTDTTGRKRRDRHDWTDRRSI